MWCATGTCIATASPKRSTQLQALIESGQLRIHRSRLQRVGREGEARLSGRAPSGNEQHWTIGGVINATGVETRASALRNPLRSSCRAMAWPAPARTGWV